MENNDILKTIKSNIENNIDYEANKLYLSYYAEKEKSINLNR
jgi:hypothetical protein